MEQQLIHMTVFVVIHSVLRVGSNFQNISVYVTLNGRSGDHNFILKVMKDLSSAVKQLTISFRLILDLSAQKIGWHLLRLHVAHVTQSSIFEIKLSLCNALHMGRHWR